MNRRTVRTRVNSAVVFLFLRLPCVSGFEKVKWCFCLHSLSRNHPSLCAFYRSGRRGGVRRLHVNSRFCLNVWCDLTALPCKDLCSCWLSHRSTLLCCCRGVLASCFEASVWEALGRACSSSDLVLLIFSRVWVFTLWTNPVRSQVYSIAVLS